MSDHEQINHLLKGIPEFYALEFNREGNDMIVRIRSPAYLQQVFADPYLMSIMVLECRPGSILFPRYLELVHFNPSTEREKLYRMLWVKMEGIVIFIVVIPKDEMAALQDAIQFTKVTLQKDIGIMAFDSEGMIEFPYQTTYSVLHTDETLAGEAEMKVLYEIEKKYVKLSKFNGPL